MPGGSAALVTEQPRVVTDSRVITTPVKMEGMALRLLRGHTLTGESPDVGHEVDMLAGPKDNTDDSRRYGPAYRDPPTF